MRITGLVVVTALTAALGGCAMTGADAPVTGAANAGGAVASLSDASGVSKASARLTETGAGLRLTVNANGLPAGALGIHMHTVGRCDPPDFASAGPHWNPTGRMHGRESPAGMHLGDLPNLMVGTDGRGSLEATITGGTLAGGANPLLDADGAALVIHAAPDDYRTDPSGTSGGRIACGVIDRG